MNILARNIRRMRCSNGLSEEDFAEIVGASTQDIANWELARIEPPTACVINMARYFGVHLGNLFMESGYDFDHELLGPVHVGY